MAYEFKKLSDVAAVETPADTANVLIEEDGVIKKAPKSAVGGAGSGGDVQSDWNQNDPTASDYVKNRTHYTQIEEVTIVPNFEYDLVSSSSYYAYKNANGYIPTPFIIGKHYTVVFDGVEYDCVAYDFENDGIVYLGNMLYQYDDAPINMDIPFLICSRFDGDMDWYTLYFSRKGKHTCEIRTMEETTHTFDSKYLPQPDMVITVNELIKNDTKPSLSNVFVERGTFKVLHDLILAGTVPNVVVRFYKNMNHIDEFLPVEATELKASVFWYGSGAVIRTVANDRNNRLICYEFVYEEGELTTIGMRYHEGTEV